MQPDMVRSLHRYKTNPAWPIRVQHFLWDTSQYEVPRVCVSCAVPRVCVSCAVSTACISGWLADITRDAGTPETDFLPNLLLPTLPA